MPPDSQHPQSPRRRGDIRGVVGQLPECVLRTLRVDYMGGHVRFHDLSLRRHLLPLLQRVLPYI